jgi:DNA-binding PadR family transcriptional regulator
MERRGGRREPEVALKELEVQVMLVLEEEPMHGYALLARLNERSSGVQRPGAASLYRALARLTDAGLLEDAEDAVQTTSTDARRRYFRPTATGRAVLRSELRRLEGVLAQARAIGIRFEGGAR